MVVTGRPESVSSRRPTALQPKLFFQSGNTRLSTLAPRLGGVPPTGRGAALAGSSRAAAKTLFSDGSVVPPPVWSATATTVSTAAAAPAEARIQRRRRQNGARALAAARSR